MFSRTTHLEAHRPKKLTDKLTLQAWTWWCHLWETPSISCLSWKEEKTPADVQGCLLNPPQLLPSVAELRRWWVGQSGFQTCHFPHLVPFLAPGRHAYPPLLHQWQNLCIPDLRVQSQYHLGWSCWTRLRISSPTRWLIWPKATHLPTGHCRLRQSAAGPRWWEVVWRESQPVQRVGIIKSPNQT